MGVARNNPENIMPKTKGGPGRLSPRRIWARSKSQTRVVPCTWSPQKGCRWSNAVGRQVSLADSNVMSLSEAERLALRQVALAKLQALSLGCHINVPKETNDGTSKKRTILLKKRSMTTGFFAEKKDKGERSSSGVVFGVPLAACVRQERQRAMGFDDIAFARSQSTSAEELFRGRLGRSGSRTSFTLLLDPKDETRLLARDSDSQSCESLNLEPKRRSFLGLSDAFSLSGSSTDWDGLINQGPQVPEIVSACFKHIETHGLHTLGIFRVSSSRKRVRQLREEFDLGHPVDLSAQHCPHDVATLLKEYFRDLPDPLLTRELYPAFLATQKVRNRKHQVEALRYLIQLLPLANCDTLWSLLQFLSKVAANANDHFTAGGTWVAGNKMDANNLATLFGPNVLHTVKSGAGRGEREFVVLTAARAEERIDVINAVRSMIDHFKEVFQVSADHLHEAYQLIFEKNPEVVEQLLNMRISVSEIDVDFDTSSSQLESLDTPPSFTAPPSFEQEDKESRTPKMENRKEESERLRQRTILPSKSESSVPSRLFRRREKSGARPAADDPTSSADANNRNRKRGSNEDGSTATSTTSRWFRRRERHTTKNLDAAIDAVNQEPSKSRKVSKEAEPSKDATKDPEAPARRSRPERSTRESSPSRHRPLTVPESSKADSDSQKKTKGSQKQQQVSVVDIRKERLAVPPVRQRRLSSPEGESSGDVISASLTLKVPIGKSSVTGTASSALSMDDRDIPYIEDLQPDQEIEPKNRPSQPYSERRHRSQPFLANRDESAPVVTIGVRHRAGSSDAFLKTAIQPQQQTSLRSRPHRSQDSVLSSEGASSMSAGSPPSLRHTPSSDFGCASASGTSTPLSTGSPPPWQSSHSTPVSPKISPVTSKRPMTTSKVEKRRYSGSRSTATSAGGDWPQDTWKRWEIIASEHTEQETLV